MTRVARVPVHRPPSSRVRLDMERLEDRSLPSTLTAPSPVAHALSTTTIDLTWHSVKGATSYPVDELENNNWVAIGTPKGDKFKVTGLSAGTEYTFEVAAANRNGFAESAPVSEFTLPAAPAVAAAASSATEIDLSWSPVSGVTGYEVKEKVGSRWIDLTELDGGSTGFAATALKAGTGYAFEVAATDPSGDSTSLAAKSTTLPVAPALTANVMSASQVDLSWSLSHGAKTYQVEENVNDAWTVIAMEKASVKHFNVSGLVPDTAYSFEVAAVDAGGTATGQPVNATTQTVTIDPNPISTVGYLPVPAGDTLFGPSGPSDLDVQQGDDGDCWLIAGLAEVAARDPQIITGMFTYDGTTTVGEASVGVYTVRLYSISDAAKYVTITSELPDGGYYDDEPVNGVLWVALAKKAYAVANGFGYVQSSNPGKDSYNAIAAGDPCWAIQAIAGDKAADAYTNPSQMAAAWAAGKFIVLGTGTGADAPPSPYIVEDHAYAVVGYNAASGQFLVLNPWGGTTSSEFCPQDPEVYGLFTASGSFISQNYQFQSVGAAAPAAAVPVPTVDPGQVSSGSNRLTPAVAQTHELVVVEAIIAPRSHRYDIGLG